MQYDFFSDMHKDCYGTRPSAFRCAWFDSLTDAEKREEIAFMQSRIDEQVAWEREQEAWEREQEARMYASILSVGCPSIADADRWIEDAYWA